VRIAKFHLRSQADLSKQVVDPRLDRLFRRHLQRAHPFLDDLDDSQARVE